jgi:hypothetical protein
VTLFKYDSSALKSLQKLEHNYACDNNEAVMLPMGDFPMARMVFSTISIEASFNRKVKNVNLIVEGELLSSKKRDELNSIPVLIVPMIFVEECKQTITDNFATADSFSTEISVKNSGNITDIWFWLSNGDSKISIDRFKLETSTMEILDVSTSYMKYHMKKRGQNVDENIYYLEVEGFGDLSRLDKLNSIITINKPLVLSGAVFTICFRGKKYCTSANGTLALQ